MAKKVFGGGEEIDRILAEPITGLRMELKTAFQKKHFPQEQYDDFIARLSKLEDLEEQKKLVAVAMQDGKLETSLDIDLATPAKQLLWAAALTRMMQVGDKPVASSEIWRQLQETISACNEKTMSGRVIYASLQNDDTSLAYGQPGSWFYYDPTKNHINLDFYFSLMMGFEHIRSINLHEIGHAELSNKYSPRMQELYDKLKDFIDPSMRDTPEKMEKLLEKQEKMTEEQQKELALISKEWELRFMLWHMVEDNCVDQFATNMSESCPQDFGYSKNVMFTALQGFGEIARGDKQDIEISSEKPRQQLKGAAEDLKKMSGHVDKMKKDMEQQQKGTLTPEQKEQYEEAKKALEEQQKALKEQEKSFEEQVAQAKKKLELMTRPLTDAEAKAINSGKISPELAEKMFMQIKTAVLVAFYEHNKLFKGTDENWRRFRIFPEDIRKTVDVKDIPQAEKLDSFAYLVDLAAGKTGINTLQPQQKDRYFGKEHYQKTVADTTDLRNQVMDHIWDYYLDKFAEVLLKEFEKKVDQECKQCKQNKGKGQGKGNSKGQGQGGQGQPGEGQGQPGQGQGGGGNQQGSGSGKPGEGGGGGEKKPMSESLKDAIKNMKEKPEDKREEERNEGAGGDKPEDKNENKGEGAGGGGEKGGEKKDKEAPGGDGWGQDPSQDQNQPQQTVGDLRKQDIIKDLTPEEKEQLKEAMKSMGKPGQAALGMGAGTGRGLDLASLAKGDWKDFNKRVLELSPIINSVAEALKQIRNAQKKQVMKQSKALDYMAEDGDIQNRLDRDKVLEIKYRQAARVPMKGDDFKKFQEDKVHVHESTIEMFLMIDGSGSMPGMRLTNSTTAMEAALQSAAIMYMAARKAGIDCYISMWGDHDPLIIARPDTDLKKVGEILETLRNGTGSGTDLAPGLKKSVAEMADHVNKNGTISGSSHVLVFSDGDIFDGQNAASDLEVMARKGKNLTVDVAVLRPQGSGGATSMENVVNEVTRKTGTRMMGVMRGHDANEIPKELARLMLRRVRSIEVKSEPDSNKRKRLKQLRGKMN